MVKNESNIFSDDKLSTEKRTENFCSNTLSALIQFSVLFWLTPRTTEKILDSFLKYLRISSGNLVPGKEIFYVISDLFLIGL